MTEHQEFIITIETGWSYLFPEITIPNIKIISTWYHYYPIEIVLAALEEVSAYCRRKSITDPDHVGAICSRNMRQRQERELRLYAIGNSEPFPERQSHL